MRHGFRGVRVVLHDWTSGDGDCFGGSNASTGEIWGVEVVEPSLDFVRRGVGEKETDLTFDTLPTTVNVNELQPKMRAYLRQKMQAWQMLLFNRGAESFGHNGAPPKKHPARTIESSQACELLKSGVLTLSRVFGSSSDGHSSCCPPQTTNSVSTCPHSLEPAINLV